MKNKKIIIIVMIAILSIFSLASVLAEDLIATAVSTTAVDVAQLPAGSQPILSSLGHTNYYYLKGIFFRAGNQDETQHYYGKESIFDFDVGNEFVNVQNGGKFKVFLKEQGSIFVDSRKRENNIPLVETMRNTLIQDGNYAFNTADDQVSLLVKGLGQPEFSSTSPVEIDSYGLQNKDGALFMPYLLLDENNKGGKIIVDANKKVYVVDKDTSVDVNGNIASSGSSGITGNAVLSWFSKITGNAVSTKAILNWDDLDGKWIGIADNRT